MDAMIFRHYVVLNSTPGGVLPNLNDCVYFDVPSFRVAWLLVVPQGRRQVGSVMSDLALALRRQPKEQAKRAFPLFRYCIYELGIAVKLNLAVLAYRISLFLSLR